MELRCFNYIQITQQPTAALPDRGKTITLDYLHSYEINTGWENLTNTAKVVIPKNVIAQDLQGNDVPLQGTNIAIGNGNNPLFLRGDKISLQAGYWYLDGFGIEQQYVKLLFTGYITKVFAKLQITLECENNAFLLKQVPAPSKVWGNNISLQGMITQCLGATNAAQNAGITVKTQSNTSISFENGTFYTKLETVAQVLERIKRDLHIDSYMKGTELRIGYPVYWPGDVQDINRPFIFHKNKNIISDNLQYMRKDDIVMSATAQSFYKEKQAATTKDGHTKTKSKMLRVFIWSDPKTQTIKSKIITDPSEVPVNEQGQRFSFFFPFASSTNELIKLATSKLEQSYYTGFRGSFTTFGMPYIPFGDNVKIIDPALPDKEGIYKIKAVKYTGGIGLGIRQELFIDYRTDTASANTI